jgi:holin-like protein
VTAEPHSTVDPADDASAPPRPVVVTIAIVLVYLSGLLNAVIGTFVLLSRYQVEPDAVLPVSLLGAAIILFGLLTLAVASGLGRGSRLARLGLTIYLAAQIVLHVVTIVVADTWDWAEPVQIALEVLILAAVWLPPGARFFTVRRSVETATTA